MKHGTIYYSRVNKYTPRRKINREDFSGATSKHLLGAAASTCIARSETRHWTDGRSATRERACSYHAGCVVSAVNVARYRNDTSIILAVIRGKKKRGRAAIRIIRTDIFDRSRLNFVRRWSKSRYHYSIVATRTLLHHYYYSHHYHHERLSYD